MNHPIWLRIEIPKLCKIWNFPFQFPIFVFAKLKHGSSDLVNYSNFINMRCSGLFLASECVTLCFPQKCKMSVNILPLKMESLDSFRTCTRVYRVKTTQALCKGFKIIFWETPESQNYRALTLVFGKNGTFATNVIIIVTLLCSLQKL